MLSWIDGPWRRLFCVFSRPCIRFASDQKPKISHRTIHSQVHTNPAKVPSRAYSRITSDSLCEGDWIPSRSRSDWSPDKWCNQFSCRNTNPSTVFTGISSLRWVYYQCFKKLQIWWGRLARDQLSWFDNLTWSSSVSSGVCRICRVCSDVKKWLCICL